MDIYIVLPYAMGKSQRRQLRDFLARLLAPLRHRWSQDSGIKSHQPSITIGDLKQEGLISRSSGTSLYGSRLSSRDA